MHPAAVGSVFWLFNSGERHAYAWHLLCHAMLCFKSIFPPTNPEAKLLEPLEWCPPSPMTDKTNAIGGHRGLKKLIMTQLSGACQRTGARNSGEYFCQHIACDLLEAVHLLTAHLVIVTHSNSI